MPSLRRRLRESLADDEVRALSRRYFVSNGFDGALTSIGVVVGAFLSGVTDGVTVVKIGVGAAVGLGTSGVWSVWEIERAEKYAELRDLERTMLADLDETAIQRRQRGGRLVNAVASGVGPIVGVLLPLVPFLAVDAGLSLLSATLFSVGTGVGVLFALGAYVGRTAELDPLVAGARMALAGVVVAVVNLVLP